MTRERTSPVVEAPPDIGAGRVLLLHPPTDSGHNFLPPLALACVHADTPEGYRVDVRDATGLRWSRLRIEDFEPYDVIGLSGRYTYNHAKVKGLIRALKRHFPEKIVIVGGQHASHDLKGCFDAGADFVVRFSSEGTWRELLERLRDRRSVEGVAGLAHRRDGEIVVEPDRPFIPPDQLPIPSFDLFRPRDYPFAAGYSGAVLEASRGCPRVCNFCTEPSHWHGYWASKSPARVVEEFDRLDALGFTFLFLADDNFGINGRLLRETFEALTARKNIVPFMAVIEPPTIVKNPDVWDLGWRAGLRIVNLDTNTIDPETNDLYQRSRKMAASVDEALRIIRRSRIAAVSNVIVGAPGETREKMVANIRFAQERADVYSNGSLEPRPGNRFWDDEWYESPERFNKGDALVHENPGMVRRLLYRAVLSYYLHPKTLVRAFFSPKLGTRILFRFQYRMYFHGAMRKFLGWDSGLPSFMR